MRWWKKLILNWFNLFSISYENKVDWNSAKWSTKSKILILFTLNLIKKFNFNKKLVLIFAIQAIFKVDQINLYAHNQFNQSANKLDYYFQGYLTNFEGCII